MVNVIEALKTMRSELDANGAQYSRLTLDTCISRLEGAEAEIKHALGRTFTPRASLAIALFRITGEKT